ncbi:hypothetical protein D3C76_1342510 [compost metagenome]
MPPVMTLSVTEALEPTGAEAREPNDRPALLPVTVLPLIVARLSTNSTPMVLTAEVTAEPLRVKEEFDSARISLVVAPLAVRLA